MKKQTIIHREKVRGKSLYKNSTGDTLTPTIVQKRESKLLRSKYRILVVHDKTGIGWAIKEFLNSECLMTNVDVATTGTDAFNMACAEDYDLIMSTYRMDYFDGPKLYRMLGEIDYKGDFIIISGFNPRERNILSKAGIKILDESFTCDTLEEVVIDLYGEHLMQRIINDTP